MFFIPGKKVQNSPKDVVVLHMILKYLAGPISIWIFSYCYGNIFMQKILASKDSCIAPNAYAESLFERMMFWLECEA